MMKRAMPPVHPGEILKEMYLENLEITVQELADSLAVTRKTVSLLLNCHAGVSVPMALRLAKAFDTTPELWLNMQRDYDLWEADKKVALDEVRHLIPIRKNTAKKVVKH